MKLGSADSPQFFDKNFDSLFVNWIQGHLSHAEREEWMRLLSQHPKLREQFCDWIRSLRDPTHHHAFNKISDSF